MSRLLPPGKPLRRISPALCLMLACAAGAAAMPMPVGAEPGAMSTRKVYRIDAGALGDVLAQFSALSGVRLSFDPALLAGQGSTGLKGSFTVAEGFARLLDGSGHELVQVGDQAYTLRRQPSVRRAPPPDVRDVAEPTLAPLRVSGDGDMPGAAAMSVRGVTKSELPLLETSRSVSVVTEEELRERQPQSVEEAVAYSAGVQVAAWGNDPRFDQVNVRGFSVTTDADFRDGLRQANTGWLSYYRTEPYALERLEIVKGPNSVLFGQVSPGGMINRVSKRPGTDSIREVGVKLGAPDHYQGQFDVADAVDEGGEWRYRLVGLARKANTGTVGVNDDSVYVAPSLTWAPSAATRVTFLTHWQDFETSGSPRPYQYPDGRLSHFWPGDVAFDYLKQKQAALGYEARHRLSDGLAVRQNLRFGKVRTDNQYLDVAAGAAGPSLPRDAYGVYENMETFAVDTALEFSFQTGPVRHAMAVGVDHSRLTGAVQYYYGSAPGIAMDSPDRRQPIARPSTLLVDQSVDGRQTGIYVNDQVSIDRWRVSAGLRRDVAEQGSGDRQTGLYSGQKDRATTASLGVLYAMAGGWSPYLSYANSFVPQLGTNLAGASFRPTEGRQIEAGLKYQPVGSRSFHTLSVFNLVQSNVKTRDPGDAMNFVQTGEVRSRGLEWESSLALGRRVSVQASYTFQAMKVTRNNDGNEGKRPVGIPRHMASAWARYQEPAGIELGLGARWTGRTYADSANTDTNPGYTLIDARVAHDLRALLRGATAALNLTNLTDREYLMCHDSYCYRGRGRSVIASLNYAW